MMATKKTKQVKDAIDPVVIVGSHSIRKEYADGRVEFESDWDKLKADVEAALATVAKVPEVFPANTKAKANKVKKAVEEVVEKIEKPKKKAAATKTKTVTAKAKTPAKKKTK